MSVYPRGPVAWLGVEPDIRALTVAKGARARIADPLFMLAQQWRMGEFRHQEGGVPIRAAITVSARPLSTVSDAAGRTEALPAGCRAEELLAEPPQTQIERAPARAPWRLGRSAERWFATHANEAARQAFDALRAEFLHSGGGDDRYLRRRAQRGDPGLDGRELLRAVENEAERLRQSPAWGELVRWARSEGAEIALPPSGPEVGGPRLDLDRVIELDPRFARDPRLELSRDLIPRRRDVPMGGFDLRETLIDRLDRGGVPTIERRVEAVEDRSPEPDADLFDGVTGSHSGRAHFAKPGEPDVAFGIEARDADDLGWWSFDAEMPPTALRGGETVTVVPTRLSFAGKPEERFWTVAPHEADWDAAPAGPTDLARMAMGAAIAQQSADWLVAPFTVPRNHLVHVAGVRLQTGFGRSFAPVAAPAPTDAAPGPHLWATHPLAAADGLLTVREPPTLRGRPLEVVDIVPDDMDNMIWLIEREVVNGDGRPRVVDDAVRPPMPEKAGEELVPTYVLQVGPPGGWYPMAWEADRFVARPFVGQGGGRRSPRALMLRGVSAIPFGVVPLEGRRLRRSWHQGRDALGRPVRWVERSSGVPERSGRSGLAYDVLLRPSDG